MLSRIADSMFWLNRYMERADGMLRVIKTNYILLLDKGIHTHHNWKPVLEMFAAATPDEMPQLENNTDAALYQLMYSKTNNNSLRIIVTRARENARGVQDHITKEVWEQVNHLYHIVNNELLAEKLQGYQALELIDDLSRQSILYTGVTDTTMPRGMGWNFMNIGRYLERCLFTIEITKKQYKQIGYDLTDTRDILQWKYLLLSLSGYELHLKAYRNNNYNTNVLHQVLFNVHFTRSVLYSMNCLEKYLKRVLTDNHTAEITAMKQQFGRMRSKVEFTDFDTLDKESLPAFLDDIHHELLDFGRRFGQIFFSYA